VTDAGGDPLDQVATPDGIAVREATPEEVAGVLGVLDAAALATDHDRVRESVAAGSTLVAVRDDGRDTDPPSETVLGALVLVGIDREDDGASEIDAVAVRRGRRAQGIGSALVAAAADRRDRLVAEFDAGVRPFYESLEFDVEPSGPAEETARFRGRLSPAEK
jgi:GNAT superfamily N-acetyltransferase